MKVAFNRKTLEKEFGVSEDENKKVRITHTSGGKLLPYTATNKNIINDYNAVVGDLSRNLSGKTYKEFYKDDLFEKVKINVEETDKLPQLHDVINEMFFDENQEFVLSHPLLFNYLKKGSNNEKKVADFLSDVLCTEKVKEAIKQEYEKKPDNILLSLLYDSLPSLAKNNKEKKNRYLTFFPSIEEYFEKDLLFLIKKNLLVDHFFQLINYYYFFYVTQLILEIDSMFNYKKKKIQPVYFNVEWETRSKKRDSYKQGWKMITAKLPDLFAHINCLTMINHIESDHEAYFSYKSLKIFIEEELIQEEKEYLKQQLDTLNTDYQSYLKDVDWSAKKPIYLNENEEPALKSVRELHHSIAYQFKNSNRNKPSKLFFQGYEDFCQKFFLKKSGPLGFTLNLDQENIIFLTKLCIKSNQKISLNELFHRMEERGVYFDRETRHHVVQFYDRLNLLEKKSDSGDAQYVKYIL
ncbi:DNA phosphorothioation-dependent restriction protein DptG [Marinococcus halophilus]|uniref:DNA phosphorothioation-dependent restriction protein DptG n=1 Tax=Marinococcus halophilus TaxID=1371 RepID=UPI0009A85FD8|nr:DNA phosphorothioation-dependent restriction protein DptG [Marinococcus halophilus]